VTWVEEMQYSATVDLDPDEYAAWKARQHPALLDLSDSLLLAKYLDDEDEDGTLWRIQADINKGEGEYLGDSITRVEKQEPK